MRQIDVFGAFFLCFRNNLLCFRNTELIKDLISLQKIHILHDIE